jgi:hypothetical protein
MSKPIVRGISVATRCGSVAEFVEHYADRVDADSILVGSALDTSASTLDRECAFAFLLANKQPVLAGTCIARKLDAATSPLRRDGLKLTIVRLGPSSRLVFETLHQMREQHASRPSQRRTVIAVAAFAFVLLVMLLQSRPRTATVRASAPTWLGTPMSARLVTEPRTVLTPRSCK